MYLFILYHIYKATKKASLISKTFILIKFTFQLVSLPKYGSFLLYPTLVYKGDVLYC